MGAAGAVPAGVPALPGAGDVTGGEQLSGLSSRLLRRAPPELVQN